MPSDSAGRYPEGPQCFALKPAPLLTRNVNHGFEVSKDEILDVAGLTAEVHEIVQLEERHLHGFEERIDVADIHYSPSLGNGTDHARVYTKGCTNTSNGGEFCEACAIAFTATTDTWDFDEDLNISLVPFCGLSQVHAGFADEMRSYMKQSNWVSALSMMTTDRCHTAYSVGTSLGGAMASLFAFCANQAAVANDADKAKFTGHFDMIPITFGAPAVAKEQVFNGRPGRCFRGARVAIQQTNTSELDAADTITGIDIIRRVLEIQTKKEFINLTEALATLKNSTKDADEFARRKMEVFEHVMPAIVLELKDVLMSILVPSSNSTSGDALGGVSLMSFVGPLIQLMNLATEQTLLDVLPFLPPPYGTQQPVHVSPSAEFAFEYDVTPGLLSGFKFQHALMPYHKVAHPEGQVPDHSFPVGACDGSMHEPKADFLKVFYATLGSFLSPVLAKSGQGNFPNHNLCCYFRGLTGGPRGSCGYNKVDGSNFACDAPSWR